MNLSRRSLLQGIFAAPAVIAADRLMPVRLWVPTIYGDAVHDDWEGLSAWMRGEKVNILPEGFRRGNDVFNIGHGTFRLSKPLHMHPNISIFGQGTSTLIRGDPDLSYVIGWEAPVGRDIGEFTVEAPTGQVSLWGMENGLGKNVQFEKYFSENRVSKR